jgi:hypothetical protein
MARRRTILGQLAECFYLHPELILKAIPAISGRRLQLSNLSQFKFSSGIRSSEVAKDVIKFLLDNEIGMMSQDNAVTFSEADKMNTALLALRLGSDIAQIGKVLNWKDFESFTSRIMKDLGYHIETNVIITKPRFQIDLVGINSKLAVIVDCKHWKYSNQGMISKMARNQIRRAKMLMSRRKNLRCGLPIILTLHDFKNSISEGIPIVSISKLCSFLMDLDYHISRYDAICTD